MALDMKRRRLEAKEEEVGDEEITNLPTNTINEYVRNLFSDYVCVFCLCTETQKCLLVRDVTGLGWWLPYIKILPSDSWSETADKLVAHLTRTRPAAKGDRENHGKGGGEEEEEMEVKRPQLFHVKRCSFPMGIRQATVITFLVIIDNCQPSSMEDQNKRWVSSDDVFEMAVKGDEDNDDTLLGSEPLQLFVKLHEGKMLADVYEVFYNKKIGADHEEVVVEEEDDDDDDDDDQEQIKKKRLSAVKELLKSANYGMRERERLYVAFMLKVFPRTEMCRTVFKREMEAIGWTKEATPSLFLAFDQKQCNFVTFRGFMIGSAVTEYRTQHGGPPAEIRCRYIFRYYNTDGDGQMKFNEFRRMVLDIRKLRDDLPKDDDGAALDAGAKADYWLFSKTPTESLPLSDFLITVGKLRFRGTSCLLRFDNLLKSFLATTIELPPDDETNRIKSAVLNETV